MSQTSLEAFVRIRLYLLILCLSFVPACLAADLNFERGRAGIMLDVISSDIEKNYFDPAIGGLNWKNEVAQTRQKINTAQSTSEIYTAMFALVNKINNSHTTFLPPGRSTQVAFGFNAKAVGDKIYIYEIKKKGPAEAAGLKAGDQIIGVNGFTAARDSYDLMMLYFRALRPVSALELVYARGNGAPQKLLLQGKVKQNPIVTDLTQDFNIWTLLREIESEEEVKFHYKMIDDIGYLQIPAFIYSEDSFFAGLLKKMNGAKAIVLDFRGNPGGAIRGLEELGGYFEPQPVVVADMVGRKKTEQIKIKPRNPNFPVPLVILVDSQSFSCSELFARHFQREGRAVVIGDHTAGYATAANFFSHKVGTDTIVPYGIQIATARVVFPGNEDLEKKGVTPDQSCLPTGDDMANDKDPCKDRAVALAHELAEKGMSAAGK